MEQVNLLKSFLRKERRKEKIPGIGSFFDSSKNLLCLLNLLICAEMFKNSKFFEEVSSQFGKDDDIVVVNTITIDLIH